MCTPRIVAERDNGTPVIAIVSTELDEVLALADRILVMYWGRIVGIVPGGTDRDVLGLMMAGVPLAEAQAQAAAHHTVLGGADRAVTEEGDHVNQPTRPTPSRAPAGAARDAGQQRAGHHAGDRGGPRSAGS